MAWLNFLGDIYNEGSWSIFGLTFKGIILGLIWLSEALFLTAIPIYIIYNLPIRPYSEDLDKWYSEKVLNYQFDYISRSREFMVNLKENPFEAIKNLKYGAAHRYCEVSIFFIENETTQYISIQNVFVGGSGSSDKSEFIHLYGIDKKIAEKFLTEFTYHKPGVIGELQKFIQKRFS
jgi:hypothetical protein